MPPEKPHPSNYLKTRGEEYMEKPTLGEVKNYITAMREWALATGEKFDLEDSAEEFLRADEIEGALRMFLFRLVEQMWNLKFKSSGSVGWENFEPEPVSPYTYLDILRGLSRKRLVVFQEWLTPLMEAIQQAIDEHDKKSS